MKLLILTTFSFCFSFSALAQQYMIAHDLQSQKTEYYKITSRDTQAVKDISLKKQGRIFLRVDNYNPFYWNAKVTAYKKPVEEEEGYGMAFNPFSVLAGGLGKMMSTLPKLDMPTNRGAGGTSANDRFLSTASSYAKAYQRVQQLNQQYEDLQLLNVQLQELKYETRKTENQIKTEARNIVQTTLGVPSLELSQSIATGRNLDRHLTNAIDSAAMLKQQLGFIYTEVDTNEVVNGLAFSQINQRAVSSYRYIDKVNTDDAFTQLVMQIGKTYNEITMTDYKFVYAVNSDPELSDLKLEIFPREGTGAKDTVVKYFSMNGRSNLRIRNSLGVAFSHFKQNNTTYYITDDSVIGEADGDAFSPVLSTFIHFYSSRVANMKWGGAFGFGIPLQGEEKDINFLLGASMIFGRNEPLMVTFGASGAKVDKLTNGNVLGGKTTETDAAKLTRSSYGIGAFVAVSFNLGSLNVSRRND